MSHFESSTVVPVEREPIAIIGIGCRYAGIDNADDFWSVLVNGIETVGEYPGGRTPALDRFYAQAGKPGGAPTSRGGFIPNLQEFDAKFFGISPREAVTVDPQQRLALEAAYQAFEDAGYTREDLAGTKTSVFLGVWNNDYQVETNASGQHEFFTLTGGSTFGGASRLCYFFDLQGSEFAINAGCASSLISVHLACQALRAGECSLALAGGANAIVRKDATLSFSEADALSADGRCKFGDLRADGFVRSEGAGVIVLKRLSEAQRDRDRIRAVILGSAVNSDGHSDGLWVRPSLPGQVQALEQALAVAGLSGAQIDYVEAHGTGTGSGDPIELGAISAVIGRAPGRTQPCLTGSAKTNLGHPESAAGIAGIIKTTLALEHAYIPPTLNVIKPNPAIDWKNGGVELALTGRSWESKGKPRYAVVSSFGLTGTNSDVVLGEAPLRRNAAAEAPGSPSDSALLLPVSAQSPESLATLCTQFAERVEEAGPDTLRHLCYTAARRRNHLAHRVAAVGKNRSELAADLRRLAEQLRTGGAESPDIEATERAPIVFVFPGQGSQWLGMGRQLYRALDAFRWVIDACDPIMQQETGWSLIEHLIHAEASARWEQIDFIQPALFAVEIALAAVWRSWGIEPAAVVGHSMGEAAAAYIAGVLTLEDAIRVICRRSRILLGARGQGAMAVVESTLAEAERAINGFHDRLSVAVSNSSRSTVLSGDPDALASVLETLEGQGVFCRRIKVDVASHSPQMDALTSSLLESLGDVQPQSAVIPFHSTVAGQRIDGAECDAAYWVRNLRRPVLFSTATRALIEAGFTTFLEMSPHPILVSSLEQTFADASAMGLAAGSLRRDEEELATLFTALGTLFANGYAVRWEALYPEGELVGLPRHIWNRKRFWLEDAGRAAEPSLSDPDAHPLLGVLHRGADGRSTWTARLSTAFEPWIKDHAVHGSVLLPASAYVEMAYAAGQQIFGDQPFAVEELAFKEALALPLDGAVPVQLVAAPHSSGAFTLRFFRKTDESEEQWSVFATGMVRTQTGAALELATEPVREEAVVIEAAAHARSMTRFGYEFGPAFRCLNGYRTDGVHASGAIHTPESVDVHRYHLHPVLLDAAFQLVGALLLGKNQPAGPLLPVELGRFRLLRPPEPGEALVATAALSATDEFSGDTVLRDRNGAIVAFVEGLRFQALEQQQGSASLDALLFQLTWSPTRPASVPSREAPGAWLLFGPDGPIASRLTAQLCARGHAVEHWREVRENALAPLSNPDLPFRGLVHLSSLERVPERSLAHAESDLVEITRLLHVLDPLLQNRPLVFVTQGAVAVEPTDQVHPAQALLWGFGAVLAKERPTTPCVFIDLDPRSPELPLDLLFESEVTRVAVRDDRRFALRLEPHPPAPEPTPALRKIAPGERFEVHIQSKGVLDSLELRAHSRREPQEHEVEIEIVASALNFIDIASAMALEQVTRESLGLECAGRVTRVGGGVTAFQPGDEVIAITPSYQTFGLLTSYATLPAELVWPKPQSLSFAEAASLPSVFMTAHYGLLELARLRAGERVLIHSAAGGVGLAAIELAKAKGAEIFATAGSEAKREYLRGLGIEHVMDSRSLDFGAEIRRITNGQGVDVVLNSLTGAAIQEGLHALAPYGRFVEIGKLDIFENTQIGLRPFSKNLSLFALDLGLFFSERREVLGEMMRAVLAQLEQGTIRPLPVTTFPVSRAAEAFQYMAAARHIGKVVLEMNEANVEVTGTTNPVRARASYLITGGFGALGLMAAAQLVELGAKHLVLAGRRHPLGEAAKQVETFRAMGVTVHVTTADLSNEAELLPLFEAFGKTMPPLRGIVHAAGVLDDGLIENLTPQQFATVLAGKAYGAALLDRLTQHLDLDFFVLFSSAAAILGSVGQANYAAANAYLDALAHQRHGRGLAATSINWGPWADIGLAAAQSNRGDRLATQGLPSFTPGEGQRLFRKLLEHPQTQVVAMHFDAALWRQWFSSVGDAHFFSALAEPPAQPSSPASAILQQLQHAAPGEAPALLAAHVRQQLAAVLRLPLAEVPVKKAFRTFGLDSLLGLELRNRLERSLGVKLPATVIWNYSNVDALAGNLLTRLHLLQSPAAPAAPAADLSPAELLAAEMAAAESLLQQA